MFLRSPFGGPIKYNGCGSSPVYKVTFRWTRVVCAVCLVRDSVTIGTGYARTFLGAVHLAWGSDNAARCSLDHLHADVRLSGSDTRRARIHQSGRVRDS